MHDAWPQAGEKYWYNLPEGVSQLDFPMRDTSYFYYCSNETIHGVEFPRELDLGTKRPVVVCDMSSNIGSRPIEWDKVDVVIASA